MAMTKSGGKEKVVAALKKIMPQKLEKASIFIVDKNDVKKDQMKVQFNPSEYRISRGNRMSQKKGVGKEADMKNVQAVSGSLASLSLSLYFDTISDLGEEGVVGKVTNIKTVMSKDASLKDKAKEIATDAFSTKTADVCDKFINLIKYVEDEHAPQKLCFVWGTLQFTGFITSCNVAYTMFAADGMPVRAKVDLTILGEEKHQLASQASKPFESPDRTKERVLSYGDPLWLLANQEYDDPTKWKVIAQANDVLNPREFSQSMTLTVPSIK